MNSVLKSLLHTIITAVLGYIALIHPSWADITIGGAITWFANWLLSHYIATTTGASARQNLS